MDLIINGEKKYFDKSVTLIDLLSSYDLPSNKVAIEHNLEIVPKSAYKNWVLRDGDKLEIVHFIGGG